MLLFPTVSLLRLFHTPHSSCYITLFFSKLWVGLCFFTTGESRVLTMSKIPGHSDPLFWFRPIHSCTTIYITVELSPEISIGVVSVHSSFECTAPSVSGPGYCSLCITETASNVNECWICESHEILSHRTRLLTRPSLDLKWVWYWCSPMDYPGGASRGRIALVT